MVADFSIVTSSMAEAKHDAKDGGPITDTLTVASSGGGDDHDLKASIGEVLEVQGNENFLHAVTAAPLNPWSKTSLQLYLILLTACLNATASGFDGVSLMSISHLLLYPVDM